jgi:hypothetical protein
MRAIITGEEEQELIAGKTRDNEVFSWILGIWQITPLVKIS